MAITNPDYIYVAKYDMYVQRSTRLFYKRCNRARKTEIIEDELVLMDKFTYTTNGYIQFCYKDKQIGAYYAFAEAFPELVGNADLHEKYPFLYTELNHKNYKHEAWEDNYPENLEWQIRSVNRADTRANVEKNNPDEKRLKESRRAKEYFQKKKQDPEWYAKFRKRSAESQHKRYVKTRPLRKQQEVDLSNRLQLIQQVKKLIDAGILDVLDKELLRKQQADDKHQLAVTD